MPHGPGLVRLAACMDFAQEIYDELQAAGAALYIMKFEAGEVVRYDAVHAPGITATAIGV